MHSIEEFHDLQVMDGSCMKEALSMARATINSLYHENMEACGLSEEDSQTLHNMIEVIEKISHMSSSNDKK